MIIIIIIIIIIYYYYCYIVIINDGFIVLTFFISYLCKIHTFLNTPIKSPMLINISQKQYNKP